ncbi:hypothetical protein AVEN_151716-1 [Araneus ventricosus]|uniref:Uncharacterized protein n=1 Tax=Araneus ventricosus TaxID=182803 RepID=A0A4Y2DRD3_ARAVE|nr:hypothetical protein AVEN_151716-1 [Araneus ventricosus]
MARKLTGLHDSDFGDYVRSVLYDSDGSVLYDNDGSVLYDNDGSVLYDSDGSVLYDSDGSVLYDSDGEDFFEKRRGRSSNQGLATTKFSRFIRKLGKFRY